MSERPRHAEDCGTYWPSDRGVCSCGLDALREKAAKWDALRIGERMHWPDAEITLMIADARRWRAVRALVVPHAVCQLYTDGAGVFTVNWYRRREAPEMESKKLDGSTLDQAADVLIARQDAER